MIDKTIDEFKGLMGKINGRFKEAKKKDMANLIGKPFRCTECEHVEFKKHVVFGEVVECSKCKGKMTEVILYS